MQPQVPSALLTPEAVESNQFKLYCYKIVPCAKKFGHDWSECPFAHEGEKATRRCPSLYLYSSIVCPDVRQSKPCPRGDVCPYSHSIFEYWMHPARFRAQICSFGPECNRRICFFAHAQEQLRVPSEPVVADAVTSRAPYLQGRVCPKSRYALYPEHVPAAIPMAGAAMQQQQLQQQQQGFLGQPGGLVGMAGQQMMPQMVMMPQDGGQGGMGGAAGGQLASLQQQQHWAAAGGGMMYVPASPAAQPGGGMGYYVASPGQAGGSGGMAAGGGGGMQQQFSAAMGMPGGQMLGAPGGAAVMYGGGGRQQPMQMMTAVAPDGSVTQYPMQAGGAGMVGGASIAYAPPMYAASMPMQQPQQWAGRGEQVQHLQTLMQVAKQGGEVIGQPGSQDSFLIAQQQPQPQPYAGPQQQQQAQSIGGMEAPAYAILAPGGATAVLQPSPQAGIAAACGGSDAGAASSGHVDDITQQMGGWRIN